MTSAEAGAVESANAPDRATGRPEGPGPQPVVLLDGVDVVHGRGPAATTALASVTCRVMPAQRIAVTGASGSGKSTLLHVMAGLQGITRGSVNWPHLGVNPAGVAGVVGMVFQSPSLLPPLNVLENVELPLLLAGSPPARARTLARQSLDRLGLQDLAGQLPEELSGGQAQRVAMARVLATAPPLILADEPTGQLDGTTADAVLDVLLTTVALLGAALVVSTHDERVAAKLPRRWRISDGDLVTDVVHHPITGRRSR